MIVGAAASAAMSASAGLRDGETHRHHHPGGAGLRPCSLAGFPGPSRDGGAYVVRRAPIIAWALESDYRGHRPRPRAPHHGVSPSRSTGAKHATNEAAILHPDGTTLDVVGSGERWEGHTTVKDWLADVDKSAKLVDVA